MVWVLLVLVLVSMYIGLCGVSMVLCCWLFSLVINGLLVIDMMFILVVVDDRLGVLLCCGVCDMNNC